MAEDEVDRLMAEILAGRPVAELEELMEGYRLSAQSEGKSPNTIAIVAASVRYLEEFLVTNGLSTSVSRIGTRELRRFTVYLKERPRFASHPFTRPQAGCLSGHTINGYLRGLQSFWAWLKREDLISDNPFSRLKIPKAPKKVMPVFTGDQLHRLFGAIDIGSATGYRDYAIILTLLDTGLNGHILSCW